MKIQFFKIKIKVGQKQGKVQIDIEVKMFPMMKASRGKIHSIFI